MHKIICIGHQKNDQRSYSATNQSFACCPKSEKFALNYQMPTVKQCGGNIMVWGCFCRDPISPLDCIKRIMDMNVYLDKIKNVMLLHGKDKMPGRLIFKQDNNPKHSANSIKKIFNLKKIRFLE